MDESCLLKKKVSLSTQSDTLVQAYIRVAPPFKVTFTSEGISDPFFNAECTCPVAKKSRFCKHIWATLLCVDETFTDFLAEKTDIGKPEAGADAPTKTQTYQETANQRASEYRKAQYQKHKVREKEKKNERKGRENAVSSSAYTPEVEATLEYFSLNGFPMPAGPSPEILADAKRTLSRVFHPDKGGTHEESVELNRHCEILASFFGFKI